MRLTHLWAILLTILLSNCNQASQNRLSTITRLFNDSTKASPSAAIYRVSYQFNTLQKDTTLFEKGITISGLFDESLLETSGVAPSRQNTGCLWTEEDSGNSNQVQLINQDGIVVASFILDGLKNNDWEDITIGPGPVAGKTYIYLAEIGDNRLQYTDKVIYRFPEPDITNQRLPFVGHISAIDVIRLQLPDGSQNAEAILVDPITQDLFLLSKNEITNVYRAPFPQPVTKATLMNPVVILPFGYITSAAVSPDGREILIRSYKELYYYTRHINEGITDALKRAPKLIPMIYEPQGEAIGWETDGSGFYTTTEKTRSTKQALHYYQRKQ